MVLPAAGTDTGYGATSGWAEGRSSCGRSTDSLDPSRVPLYATTNIRASDPYGPARSVILTRSGAVPGHQDAVLRQRKAEAHALHR
eukprot:2198178-Rhodomonas_salina.1